MIIRNVVAIIEPAHGHSSITEVLNFIFSFVAFNFFSRLLMYSLLSSESACY